MTETEAREILSGRLIFGDARQIEARRLLTDLAHYRTRCTQCPRCKGAGWYFYGRQKRERICQCVSGASWPVLVAMGLDNYFSA